MKRFLMLLAVAFAVVAGTIRGQEPAAPKPKSTGEIITIKLLIAEIPEKAEGQEGAEPLDLSKPGEQVLAQVEALVKQRRARRIQRIEIATVEGHTAQVVFAEIVPALTAILAAGPGKLTPHHTLQDVGTIVSVTPRLAGDDQIALELTLTSSRLQPPEIPMLEKDLRNFRPAGTTNSMIQTTMRVSAGKPTVLTKFETAGEPDAYKHVAIVTAATTTQTESD